MPRIELPFENDRKTPMPDVCLVTGMPGAPLRKIELTTPVPAWVFVLPLLGIGLAVLGLQTDPGAGLLHLLLAVRGLWFALAGGLVVTAVLGFLIAPTTAVLHLPLQVAVPDDDQRVALVQDAVGLVTALDDDGEPLVVGRRGPLRLVGVRNRRLVLEVPSEEAARAVDAWLRSEQAPVR